MVVHQAPAEGEKTEEHHLLVHVLEYRQQPMQDRETPPRGARTLCLPLRAVLFAVLAKVDVVTPCSLGAANLRGRWRHRSHGSLPDSGAQWVHNCTAGNVTATQCLRSGTVCAIERRHCELTSKSLVLPCVRDVQNLVWARLENCQEAPDPLTRKALSSPRYQPESSFCCQSKAAWPPVSFAALC